MVSPIKTGQPSAVSLAFSLWQEKFKGSLSEIVKIISVDVPGKNPELFLVYLGLLSFSMTAALACIAASAVLAASPATIRCRT
jgi:hypothetical protein